MRKQEYLKQVSAKDRELLRVMKSCQHLSAEQIQRLISKNRVQSYQKQGLIRKVHYIKQLKQMTAYELTPKGRAWMCKHLPELGSRYYTCPTAVHHNINLAEQILQHNGNWLNEQDLRKELIDRIDQIQDVEERFRLLQDLEQGKFSVPDGGYYENEQLVCVEIYNMNYSEQCLEAKAECANLLGAQLHLIKQT